MNDDAIEQAIQDKGLTAPRVTPDRIEGLIVDEDYHVFPGTTLTVCVLTLENGFTVTGESACASPDNFDEGIGRGIARNNAREKVWLLEGYLLRQRLHEGEGIEPMADYIAGKVADALDIEMTEEQEQRVSQVLTTGLATAAEIGSSEE